MLSGRDVDPDSGGLDREQLKHLIIRDVHPGTTGILKTDGTTRRLVTSNTGDRIAMRTGVKTRAVKSITLDMVWFAYRKMNDHGRLDSRDFRAKFPRGELSRECFSREESFSGHFFRGKFFRDEFLRGFL